MTIQVSIEPLLSAVAQQLETVRVARERYAIKLSPEFNCFDYIYPDEMRLSEIIADLLNPKGKHSQGRSFLFAFLRRIGLEQWYDGKEIQVNTEVLTFNKRRFDIEIKWDNRKLVIENKPWAEDQDNQLSDYIEDLRKNNLTEWHLVYLSGTGQEPSDSSISEKELMECKRAGLITLADYENLVLPWLDDCKSVCESERFRWFLGELKLYVLAEFKGEHDMQERQAVKEQVLKNSDSLNAALEISSAMADIKQKLLKIFEQQLQEHVKKLGWGIEWYGSYWKRYTGFNLTIMPKQRYQLTFQFEKAPLNDLHFGMSKIEEKLPDKPEITELMEKVNLGLGSGKTTSWWPWWAPVKEEMRNWENNSLPWLKIQDGSLAVEFIRMAEICYDIFKQEDNWDLIP
jgi:PD-(D/E)XK nuclease superfamily